VRKQIECGHLIAQIRRHFLDGSAQLLNRDFELGNARSVGGGRNSRGGGRNSRGSDGRRRGRSFFGCSGSSCF
jgi:hypothetical protein